MHCFVHAIGAEDGSTHVLLHLPPAQHAWSAALRFRLQRLSGSIPLLIPSQHYSLAARYSMASSECSKGMSGGARNVLEEDAMLMLWSELLHGSMGCTGGKGVQ